MADDQLQRPGMPPLYAAPPQMPTGPTSPFDLGALVQQVANLPQYQQATNQLQQNYGQLGDIRQQQAQLEANPPQRTYQPNYEKITGVGSALKDVGKGILQGLSFTGPGQAVSQSYYQNRPGGVKDWESRREMLANQLATVKSQQEVPTEEMRGLTGLTQAGGLAAYRGGELQDRQARTQAYTQNIQNRLEMGMRGLDLRAAIQGDQKALMQARTVLANVMAQVEPERVNAQLYGIDHNNATRMAMANVLAASGIGKEYATSNFIDNLFGTSFTPVAPQAPGGATPTGAPVPKRGATNQQAAPPARPKGVPANAQWNPQTRTWQAQ